MVCLSEELDLKPQKKLKTDSKNTSRKASKTKEPEQEPEQESEQKQEPEKLTANSSEKQFFDALILVIKSETFLDKKVDEMKEKVSEILKQDVPYVRFNKTEGHLIVDRRTSKDDLIAVLLEKGIMIDQVTLQFSMPSDQDKEEFWNANARHFEGVFKKTCGKGWVVIEDGNRLVKPILFVGSRRYRNSGQIKSAISRIMHDNKVHEPVINTDSIS